MHVTISLPAALLAACLSAASLPAQQALPPVDAPAPTAAPRVRSTSNNIRLDGIPDEPEWFLADSITDFRQRDPVEGALSSERTVVRLLATPEGLAVGWWLADRDVAHRVRTQLRRDAALRSDDYVSLMIDGLSDRRSAFYFRTNSNGALWDGEHVNVEDGNEEWDGVWDSRSHVGTDGWTVEMLIPWATLRYPKDVNAMGMNFRRFLPRKNEETLWRAWKRTQGFRFLEEEGQVEGFRDLPPRARAELRPFVVTEGSLAERGFRLDGTDSVVTPATGKVSAGLDVKLPVTATLTADLTVFPDFAQAEADRQVVNLSRFPLFFPEQRTFFTEGADIFAFGRAEVAQLFYSRRVGLGASGTPVDIPFGARMQGRLGSTRVGFLAVRTGDGEDATNLVARVRKDILGRGYVGVMTTFSDQAARPGALAGGADFDLPFIVRGGDNLSFSGSAAWSRDSAGGPSGGYYRLTADYPNDHADVVVRAERIEAGYDPALGFVTQRGITRLGGATRITPRPGDAHLIRRYEFDLLNYNVVWDVDGRLDNAVLGVRPFGVTFQAGDRLELNAYRVFDGPVADFEIVPGTMIAAGDYWWDRAEVVYIGSNVRKFSMEMETSIGPFYDGSRTDVAVAGLLRLQPHVELRAELEHNDVSLSAGDFSVTTARLRGDYAFSPRLTATLFAQVDNGSDRAAVNARLRWTTSPGSDLYLVWNSAWPTGLDRGIPWERPLRGGVVAKYVRFFRR